MISSSCSKNNKYLVIAFYWQVRPTLMKLVSLDKVYQSENFPVLISMNASYQTDGCMKDLWSCRSKKILVSFRFTLDTRPKEEESFVKYWQKNKRCPSFSSQSFTFWLKSTLLEVSLYISLPCLAWLMQRSKHPWSFCFFSCSLHFASLQLFQFTST